MPKSERVSTGSSDTVEDRRWNIHKETLQFVVAFLSRIYMMSEQAGAINYWGFWLRQEGPNISITLQSCIREGCAK